MRLQALLAILRVTACLNKLFGDPRGFKNRAIRHEGDVVRLRAFLVSHLHEHGLRSSQVLAALYFRPVAGSHYWCYCVIHSAMHARRPVIIGVKPM